MVLTNKHFLILIIPHWWISCIHWFIFLYSSARGNSPKKKAGRPKALKQEKITEHGVVKKKRKVDRFKGMPEEEVLQRLLPDHLAENLDIVIVRSLVLNCFYSTNIIVHTVIAYICVTIIYGTGFVIYMCMILWSSCCIVKYCKF